VPLKLMAAEPVTRADIQRRALMSLRSGWARPTTKAAAVLNESHADFNASLPAHLSSVGLTRAFHYELKLAWD
jgi:hypothetical protein